ncbi:hypothetical protein SLS55_000053 [Diplodia seriata]|uniref:Glycoprotein n=1 Tax=Diplodia seriata TaxID=420778 RepID=A0ABR3CU98_9PEZI
MRYALSEATTLFWWKRALHGTTLSELHNYWAYGASLKDSMLSGRKFNLVALASILTSAVVLDGPLIQRSSKVATTQATRNTTLSIQLASRPFPRGFSGGTLSHFPTINYYTSPFAQVVHDYSIWSDIRLKYSGCVEACDTHVEAPGFDVSCTRGKRPYNYKPYGDDGDYSDDVGKNHYAGSTAVEFSGREGAGTIHVNVEYKTNSTNCTGDFTIVNCTLQIAKVLYPITLRNGVVTLMPAGTNDTIELQDILDEEPGMGLKPSTIGGIADAASKIFDSSVSFVNEGPGYAVTGQGRMANMYGKLQLSDFTASVGCDNLTWSDPTLDVLGALRQLVSRSAIAASNASTVQDVHYVDSYQRTIYVSHYPYLAAALCVIVANALAVLSLFIGWWALGRKATMSPLELAKAFQSPLTSGCNQNEIKGLLESVGPVKVRYGDVTEKSDDRSEGGVESEQHSTMDGLEMQDFTGAAENQRPRLGTGALQETKKPVGGVVYG